MDINFKFSRGINTNKFPWLLILLTLVSFYISLQNFLGTKDFLRTAQYITAEVTDLVPHTDKDNTTYAPEFRFRDRMGELHKKTSSVSSKSPSYKVGDKAMIYVNFDSMEMREDNFFGIWGLTFIFIILGVIFGSPCAWSLFVRYRRASKKKLIITGERVNAKIISFEESNLVINNTVGFHLLAQGINPITGQEEIFKSEQLSLDPRRDNTISTIAVYVDQKLPHRYYMDLTSL